MRYTISIKLNRDFRRLYASGKTAANAYLAVYCRKNRLGVNRLGLTVSTKVGKAVVRNRVRRRIREAYRLCEDRLARGYDIIIVSRTRTAAATFWDIDRALRALFEKLGLFESET